MTWNEVHPALNASLNGAEFVFLVAGWRAIRRRDIATHRAHMICALVASATFLVSYVIRFAMSGAHRYPGAGWDRIVYLAILVSHSLIAVAVLPFILRTAYLALTSRFAEHRRVARWVWPVWIYVSVTGVVVYLMLYQLGPRLHPAG